MSLFSFVKANVSILDLVSEYVSLRQMGNYWKGSCPFHNETDASFTVSPDKGIFYCFGCHTGGDVVSFIGKSENLQPHEAAQHLVEHFKLKVPDEIAKSAKDSAKYTEKKNDYFSLCENVAQWAFEQLQANTAALSYLEKRGIGQDQINYFGIGYFKGGMRGMNHFVKTMANHSILTKDLLETGILVQGRSALYSPFEERIIFPIKDSMGRHCGFGGRVFKPTDERAKYYNSKESEWFSKGKLLFGLDSAKKALQQKGRAFLVEGYTDCVAMIKAGYYETVATLGTACTHDHLKILARYINTLYVLYDGDAAGKKAILRLTQLCWDVNLNLRVISLPPAHDPASFINSGDDLERLIGQARDIFTFYVESLSDDFVSKTLSEKLELTRKIVEVIAAITDQFKQDLLLQEAAAAMQVPFDSLKKVLHKQKEKAAKKNPASDGTANQAAVYDDAFVASWLEEKIVACVINSVSLEEMWTVEHEILTCFSPLVQELIKKAEAFESTLKEKQRFQAFLQILTDEEQQWVIKICVKHDGTRETEFAHLISMFQKQNWKQIVKNLRAAILKAKQTHDTPRLERLLGEFIELKKGIQDKGLV